MQVWIRKMGTALYWNASGRWTQGRDQASDLQEVCRAVNLCLHRGWVDAELVIRFERMAGEMTLPVASIPTEAARQHSIRARRQSLSRKLQSMVRALPFRRRRKISYGCRRNTGPGGYGCR